MIGFSLNESEFGLDFIKSNFDLFGKECHLTMESEWKERFLRALLHNCILYLHKLKLLRAGANYDLEEPFAKSRVVQFIQLLNLHFKEEITWNSTQAK